LIGKLVDKGWVRNVADLYRLQREDLLSLGAKVEKSTDRLLESIERSKSAEMWRVVYGLGIPQVGEVAARELARRFDCLEALARATEEELTARTADSPRLSAAAVRAVVAFFAQAENREMANDLVKAGLGAGTPAAPEPVDTRLAGKVFVLTGTLPNLTRSQATALIERAGGTVATSVTRTTDFVVAGEGAGAKLDAARTQGVKVIDEADLRGLLDDE
jgi:DNA ligase (NAD+)